MPTQKESNWLEVSRALGNIGMFLGAMIIAVVGYTFTSTVNNLSDDIKSVQADVKELLKNDAATKSSIRDIQRRVDRTENLVDKLRGQI